MEKLEAEDVKRKRMLDDVLAGLKKTRKTLPSKYFYDQRGSELFEKICSLEEYYPTNTEVSIMRDNIDEISTAAGTDIELIEFGSGSSYKTRLLLDYLEKIQTYFPVDISGTFLNESVQKLKSEYPGLQIEAVTADYTQPFDLPVKSSNSKKVIYFPGSTIGNFTPGKARKFLGRVAKMIKPDGGFLVGVDLKKDPEILVKAYNDSKGVTAEFNKNLLVRINRELGANFNLDRFEHRALYNDREGRIEMHLVSLIDQEVIIEDTDIYFQEGESIHTENSYKYTPEEFKELASGLLKVKRVWTDDSEYFSVQYLEPDQPS